MRMISAAMGASLAVTMTVAPAFARPVQIATLGHAPVLGASTNAAELRSNLRKHEAIMRRAGLAIGLTPTQYDTVRTTIEVGKPNWVTVPRHLDVMTWAYGGQVHTLHDVIIPPDQKGFAVEFPENGHGQTMTVYIPAKCGNISLARRAVRHVAAARIRNFPVPHPAPVVAPVVAAAPPTVVAPAVVAPPPPVPVAPVAAVAHHGIGLLPLAAVLPFLFHGGGGGSVITPFLGNNTGGGGTIVSPPPCPPGTDP